MSKKKLWHEQVLEEILPVLSTMKRPLSMLDAFSQLAYLFNVFSKSIQTWIDWLNKTPAWLWFVDNQRTDEIYDICEQVKLYLIKWLRYDVEIGKRYGPKRKMEKESIGYV